MINKVVGYKKLVLLQNTCCETGWSESYTRGNIHKITATSFL